MKKLPKWLEESIQEIVDHLIDQELLQYEEYEVFIHNKLTIKHCREIAKRASKLDTRHKNRSYRVAKFSHTKSRKVTFKYTN